MKLIDALTARIKELQHREGWKQYEVSKKSTVPQTTLVSIKKGRTLSMDIKTIYRLCEGFDMSLQEFFASDFFDRENLELE